VLQTIGWVQHDAIVARRQLESRVFVETVFEAASTAELARIDGDRHASLKKNSDAQLGAADLYGTVQIRGA
jgi:hypothetical protein